MIGTVKRIYDDYVEIELGTVLTVQLSIEALPAGLRQGDRVQVELSLRPYHGKAKGKPADLGVTLAWS